MGVLFSFNILGLKDIKTERMWEEEGRAGGRRQRRRE